MPSSVSVTILGMSLFGFSVSALGEEADNRLSLSGMTSAFGEIAMKQAFADGSYVVTVHPRSKKTGRAEFTITAGFNKADVCLYLVLDTHASDEDIAPSTDFANSVMEKADRHCYPADDEQGLEAFKRMR